MINVKQVLVGSLVILNVLLNNLSAVQVKTEFYPAGRVPPEYQMDDEDRTDRTVILIDGWDDNSKVNIDEKRLDKQKKQRLGEQIATEGKITWVISPLGYFPGFPVKYFFEDVKNKVQQEVEVVPNRIIVKSPVDNAEIEAKVVMTNPVNYLIMMSGFKEKEKINFSSKSYDEKMACPLVVNRSLEFGCMTGVINQRGGVAELTFKRPSGEVLKLELPWGCEWLRYTLVYDDEGKPISYIDTPEFRNKMPNEAKYFDAKSKKTSRIR